jgi:hypothetical protein
MYCLVCGCIHNQNGIFGFVLSLHSRICGSFSFTDPVFNVNFELGCSPSSFFFVLY